MKKQSLILAITGLLVLTGCSNVNPEQIDGAGDPTLNETAIEETQSQLAYEIDSHDFVDHMFLIENIEAAELSQAETDGLIQMREEEKLARDVYLTLGDVWGQQIFTNIASSENTHTEAVKTLLDRYEIEDPVTDDTIGVFQSETMQGLYDELVEQGSKSLTDALVVGATIEDLDINDLNNLLGNTDNEDIIIIYENLAKGSRNHMRAFMRNLENQGGSYEAQYISADELQTILDSEQERGQAGNGSRGNYRGQGNGRGERGGRR